MNKTKPLCITQNSSPSGKTPIPAYLKLAMPRWGWMDWSS